MSMVDEPEPTDCNILISFSNIRN